MLIFISITKPSLFQNSMSTYILDVNIPCLIFPVFEALTPYDRCHKVRKLVCLAYPKTIHPVDGLGLQLFYLRNRGVQWVLCTVFGMTQSQVSNYLRFSRRILIKLLSKTNIAKTSVPDSTDIEKFVEAIFLGIRL